MISRLFIFLVILTSPSGILIDFLPAVLIVLFKSLFDVGTENVFWSIIS